MRLITFRLANQDARIGVLHGDTVTDIAELAAISGAPALPKTMIGLLEAHDRALAANHYSPLQWLHEITSSETAFEGILLGDVALLPPVLNPEKVICLGLNYRAHAAEKQMTAPTYPMLFHKGAGSLLGAGGTIRIPPVAAQVDYEGELAVIIGRTCVRVSADEALGVVAGYTCANDVSARNLQYRTKQFTQGKMLDTFCPLGPALVSADAIPDPHALTIRTTLNGERVQDGHTSAMIFRVPEIISYISQFATLRPGDVILTGTPEGVGFARDPQLFMQPGDRVCVTIDGIGTLCNDVEAV